MSVLKPKTPAEQAEFDLRRHTQHTYASDAPLLKGADMIRQLDQENQVLRARVEHAETRLTKVLALLEPQQWAENSRNRTALLEAIIGAPQLTVIERQAA